MLKIRLRRTGAKKQPAYRLVVAESTSPRDGTFLEILGHYNPLTEPTTFDFKEDRVREWLKQRRPAHRSRPRLLAARGIMPAPAYVPTPAAGAAADRVDAPWLN